LLGRAWAARATAARDETSGWAERAWCAVWSLVVSRRGERGERGRGTGRGRSCDPPPTRPPAPPRLQDSNGAGRGASYDPPSSHLPARTGPRLLETVLSRLAPATSLAAMHRRRAMTALTSQGDPAPFLALLGSSLATGATLLTRRDQQEAVCWEVRRAAGSLAVPAPSPPANLSLADFQLGTGAGLGQGCAAVVLPARARSDNPIQPGQFPLAIKMMFNYHAESSSHVVLRAFRRELVPARAICGAELGDWVDSDLPRLPPHPNIIEVVAAFADRVPGLEQSCTAGWEAALPVRLHPAGLGRNMALFLVMPRYHCSLAEYLAQHSPLQPRAALLLLAQLLEGVAHLASNTVAHRDLKPDNLLVGLGGGADLPHLVVSDFGSCLASRARGWRLPHPSWDTDLGGNTSLMAPEVAAAQPGPWQVVDYSRADLWAAACIARQLYGLECPFQVRTADNANESKYMGLKEIKFCCVHFLHFLQLFCQTGRLDSRSYRDSELDKSGVPAVVSSLLTACLARDPSRRPAPRTAATVVQLLLWAPSTWCRQGGRPDTQAILQWLLTVTTKLVCEARYIGSCCSMICYFHIFL